MTAMHAVTQFFPVARSAEVPLAQVEVLLLFHPAIQHGGTRRVAAEACARATQGWLTLDVHGTPAKSELNGQPILENLRLTVNGEDLELILPDQIVSEVAGYVLESRV